MQSWKEEAVPFEVAFEKMMNALAVAVPAHVNVIPNKDIDPVPEQETADPVVVLLS